MTPRETILATEAAELYEIGDGESVNGWVRIADEDLGESRWHHNYWLVVQREEDKDAGVFYGISYAHGLTEYQDHEYPWENGYVSLPLVRLYRHSIVQTVYMTRPVESEKIS